MSGGRRTPRLAALAAVVVAAVTLGSDVAGAQPDPQKGGAPPSLTRKYPLGAKRLCCRSGSRTSPAGGARTAPRARSVPVRPPTATGSARHGAGKSGGDDHGSFGLLPVLAIAVLLVLLIVALVVLLRREGRARPTLARAARAEGPVPGPAPASATRAESPALAPASASAARAEGLVPGPAPALAAPAPRSAREPVVPAPNPAPPAFAPAPEPAVPPAAAAADGAVVKGRRRRGGLAGALRRQADYNPVLWARISARRGGRTR